MRGNTLFMAITCGTPGLLVTTLGAITALDKEIGALTSLIVTAVIPTITSLIALERSARASGQLRNQSKSSHDKDGDSPL